jgi:hypothetical protein
LLRGDELPPIQGDRQAARDQWVFPLGPGACHPEIVHPDAQRAYVQRSEGDLAAESGFQARLQQMGKLLPHEGLHA